MIRNFSCPQCDGRLLPRRLLPSPLWRCVRCKEIVEETPRSSRVRGRCRA